MKLLLKTMKMAILLALLAVLVEPLTANTIKKVKLQDGREDANKVRQAVYDTSGVGVLVIDPIEPSYVRDGFFAYKMNPSLLTPKPKLKNGLPTLKKSSNRQETKSSNPANSRSPSKNYSTTKTPP